MNTKLTLRIDESLIKSAKEYSAESGKSLSKIVADFFVIIKNEKLKSPHSVAPQVQSLKGILKDIRVCEKEYNQYLEDKYLGAVKHERNF